VQPGTRRIPQIIYGNRGDLALHKKRYDVRKSITDEPITYDARSVYKPKHHNYDQKEKDFERDTNDNSCRGIHG
jgi:hypothetical protein